MRTCCFRTAKCFIVYALLALDVSHLSEVKAAANVQPVILPGGCEYSCSSVPLQERNKAGQVISNAVSSAISSFVQEEQEFPCCSLSVETESGKELPFLT